MTIFKMVVRRRQTSLEIQILSKITIRLGTNMMSIKSLINWKRKKLEPIDLTILMKIQKTTKGLNPKPKSISEAEEILSVILPNSKIRYIIQYLGKSPFSEFRVSKSY